MVMPRIIRLLTRPTHFCLRRWMINAAMLAVSTISATDKTVMIVLLRYAVVRPDTRNTSA